MCTRSDSHLVKRRDDIELLEQVNGQDLRNASHNQALEAFREAKDPIIVEVARRGDSNSSSTESSSNEPSCTVDSADCNSTHLVHSHSGRSEDSSVMNRHRRSILKSLLGTASPDRSLLNDIVSDLSGLLNIVELDSEEEECDDQDEEAGEAQDFRDSDVGKQSKEVDDYKKKDEYFNSNDTSCHVQRFESEGVGNKSSKLDDIGSNPQDNPPEPYDWSPVEGWERVASKESLTRSIDADMESLVYANHMMAPGKLDRPPPNLSKSSTHSLPENTSSLSNTTTKQLEVTLTRQSPSDKFGLTLCYHQDDNRCEATCRVYIGEIEQKTPPLTSRSNPIDQLRVGDRILRVNGQPIESRDQAIELFRVSTSKVTLVIERSSTTTVAAQFDRNHSPQSASSTSKCHTSVNDLRPTTNRNVENCVEALNTEDQDSGMGRTLTTTTEDSSEQSTEPTYCNNRDRPSDLQLTPGGCDPIDHELAYLGQVMQSLALHCRQLVKVKLTNDLRKRQGRKRSSHDDDLGEANQLYSARSCDVVVDNEDIGRQQTVTSKQAPTNPPSRPRMGTRTIIGGGNATPTSSVSDDVKPWCLPSSELIGCDSSSLASTRLGPSGANSSSGPPSSIGQHSSSGQTSAYCTDDSRNSSSGSHHRQSRLDWQPRDQLISPPPPSMRPDEAENEELSAPQSSLDVLQPATLVSSIQNRPINAFNSESSLLSLMNVPTHPTDNTSALVSSQPSVGHHRAFDRFDRGPQSRLVLVGGKDKKFNQSTTQWLHELVDRSPHSSDLNQDQRSVSSSSGSSHYCQSFIDNQPRSRGKLHLRNHQRSSKALPPKAPKDCIHPLLTPSSSPVTATTTSSLSVVSNSCLTTTTSSIHPSHPSPHPYEVYARVDDDDDEKWSHQEPNNLVGNSTSKNTNNDTDDIYETPYASVTVADDGPTSPSQCQSQSANWPNCPCPSLLHLHDGNVLSPTGSTTTTSDGGGVDMRSILRPTINSLLTASANKSQHDHQQLDGQVLPLSTGGSVHFQIAMDRDGDDKDGAMEWVVKKRPDGSRYITRRPIRNRLLKEYNQHSKEQHLSGIVAEEREVPDINHSPKRETLMGTIHHSQTRSRHRNHLSYSPDRHRKRSISKKNHKHDRNRHIQQKSRRTKSNRAKYSCTEKETSIKVLHSDQTLAKMEVRKSGTCCEKKTEVHDPKSVVSNSFQLVTMTTV